MVRHMIVLQGQNNRIPTVGIDARVYRLWWNSVGELGDEMVGKD